MTPDTRYVFHLSIPVAELQRAKRFYVEALGATFGPWNEWEALAASLQRTGVPLLGNPSVEHAGTPNEQAKLYLEDPSHNLIEVKAYRDIAGTLGVSDAGYR